MAEPTYDSVNVGDAPIAFTSDPVSRRTLALYAGASGDHNPIHIDIDFAKKAGLGDVIAHGMLIMAYMGRSVTNWVPQSAIRTFETKFTAITRVGDAITCTGTIAEKMEADGETRVRVEITAQDQKGEVKGSGEAIVALP